MHKVSFSPSRGLYDFMQGTAGLGWKLLRYTRRGKTIKAGWPGSITNIHGNWIPTSVTETAPSLPGTHRLVPVSPHVRYYACASRTRIREDFARLASPASAPGLSITSLLLRSAARNLQSTSRDTDAGSTKLLYTRPRMTWIVKAIARSGWHHDSGHRDLGRCRETHWSRFMVAASWRGGKGLWFAGGAN